MIPLRVRKVTYPLDTLLGDVVVFLSIFLFDIPFCDAPMSCHSFLSRVNREKS